jgi:O-antigen/teichoic acid export membrane protein
MRPLKVDLVANFAGQGGSTMVGLALVPIYLKFLGVEAYGLIGFYALLQGATQVLDLGLSPTMNREMARYSVEPEKAETARDLVRTLEVVYWGIGVLIAVVLLGASPVIASRWIKAGAIPIDVVQQSIMCMALLAALQWPLTFYQGSLLGLHKQLLLNGLQIAMVTLRFVGTILVLWKVSRSITSFFIWQIIAGAIHVTLITIFLWRSLPPAQRPARVKFTLIRSIWRFSAGMSGITLSALILTQVDKVILSKLLSLEMFGYYSLAITVAGGLAVIIKPIFNTLFSRFSALSAQHNIDALRILYHQSSQLLAVLILPLGCVIAFFSFEVLWVWTRNAPVARNAAAITSLLVIGYTINGLMNLPYLLQLANGWTGLGLRINGAFIVTLVPAIFFMTVRFGAIGAGAVWVALNVIYILVGVPLTHRRLLKGESKRWYMEDVLFPLIGPLLLACIARPFVYSSGSELGMLLDLGLILTGAILASMLGARHIREWAWRVFTKQRRTWPATAV